MSRLLAALLAIGAILASLLALDLWLLLSPEQVEARIRRTLAASIRTRFELRDVSFALRSGLRIHGLVIEGPEREPAISIEEASIDIDWRRLALGEIRVVKPALDLRVSPEGKLSLLEIVDPDLLRPDEDEPDGPGTPDFPTATVIVEDASLRFMDRSGRAPEQVLWLGGLDVEIGAWRDHVNIRGALEDPLFKEASFSARLEKRTGVLRAALDIRKARIAPTPELRARIPPNFWGVWDLLRLEGTGDLTLRVLLDPGRPPIIRGQVKVHSGGLTPKPFPYKIRDVVGTVRLEDEGRGLHVILENCRGERAGGRFRGEGDIWPGPPGAPDRVDIRVQVENLPVDEMLADAMPPEVQPIYRRFSPEGRASGRIRISGETRPPGVKDEIEVSVQVDAHELRARFDELPLPVAVAGRLDVQVGPREQRFTIEELTGTAAGGALAVHGVASPRDIDVRIRVAGARVDERIAADLKPDQAAIVERLAPRGKLDADVHVTSVPDADGDGVEPVFEAHLRPQPGLTVKFAEFPYEIAHRSGEVVITPAGARAEGVEATGTGGSPLSLTLSADIRSDKGGGAREVRVDAVRLPVDARLQEAARPRAAELFAELGPEAGEVTAVSLLARAASADAPVELEIDARVAGVTLRPARAGVPITGLRGWIHVDPKRVEVDDVEGRLARTPVRASGVIGLEESVSSTAVAIVRGLELTEDLRAILPPGARDAWKKVQPQGVLDVELRIRGSGASATPEVSGKLARGAFLLEGFPLAATGLSAAVHASEGLLRVDRLRGKLGTGDFEAYGFIHLPPVPGLGAEVAARRPRTSLHLSLRNLPLDARLIDAFPDARRKALTELNLGGRIALDLNAFYDPVRDGGTVSYAAELGLAEGAMDVGLELEDVAATVTAHGTWIPDVESDPEIHGGFHVRRAVWKNQPIERVRGLFRAGPEMLELSEMRGEFLGGIAKGRFHAFSRSPRLIGAEFSLAGGRLERWVEARYRGKRRASGLLEGELCLSGEAAEEGRPGDLRGEGALRIRDAHLVELPLFVGIFNAMSLQLPGRPVFDRADVAFGLEDRKIRVDRTRISSPAVTLYGKGSIQDGLADLRLTPELGRSVVGDAPFIGAIWTWWKNRMVIFEVKGPLDDPQVRTLLLPDITGPARDLIEGK